MLTAKDHRGQLYSFTEAGKTHKSQVCLKSWYCPACGGEVIPRVGKMKRAHFAHVRANSCNSYSEGETEEHLSGKILLEKSCKHSHSLFQLEAYLVKLKQRADLLLGKTRIVEFQCSPISAGSLLKRTRMYQKYHYQVFWIVGEKFFIQNKLTAQQKLFLNYQEKIGFYYWELDVKLEQLRLLYHIEQTESGNVSYLKKSWKVYQEDLIDILNYPTEYAAIFYRKYNRKREEARYRLKLKEGIFWKNKKLMESQYEFYKAKQTILNLPDFFYYPMKHSFVLKSPLLWKKKLFEAIQLYKKENDLEKNKLAKVIHHMEKQEVSLYPMPCVPIKQMKNALVYNYLKSIKV